MDLFEWSDDRFWIGTTSRFVYVARRIVKVSLQNLHGKKRFVRLRSLDRSPKTRTAISGSGSRCGTKKWARYGFTSYNEADGLAYPQVNSIFENRDGELFASTILTGVTVSRFDGEKFELVKPNFPPGVGIFGLGLEANRLGRTVRAIGGFRTEYGLFRFPKPGGALRIWREITPQKSSNPAQKERKFSAFLKIHAAMCGSLTTGTQTNCGVGNEQAILGATTRREQVLENTELVRLSSKTNRAISGSAREAITGDAR